MGYDEGVPPAQPFSQQEISARPSLQHPSPLQKAGNGPTTSDWWFSGKDLFVMYRFFLPRHFLAFLSLAVTSALSENSFHTSSNYSWQIKSQNLVLLTQGLLPRRMQAQVTMAALVQNNLEDFCEQYFHEGWVDVEDISSTLAFCTLLMFTWWASFQQTIHLPHQTKISSPQRCAFRNELSAPSSHSYLSPEMYLNNKFDSDMPRFLHSWFVEVRVQCLTSAAMLEFCTWVSSLPCCMCHHRVPARPLCLPLDPPLHQQQILFTLTHNFRKQSQSWHPRSSHEPSHCQQRTGLGPLDEIE